MMEAPTPPAPIPQKRPLDEDVEPCITTPVKAPRSETSSPLSVRSVQTPSPFKPSATQNTSISSGDSALASSAAQQPAKRRRLTQKEKDDQKLEKEAKAKARAEKKAQKEAEDKLKEEEKQKKADEREEKRKQKEEEQQQKEEEKAKKERVSLFHSGNNGVFANCLVVSDEAQCFLYEAKSYGCQSWKGLGRVFPKPHLIISISIITSGIS
jgi:chromatin assembly factor 1 subunit A